MSVLGSLWQWIKMCMLVLAYESEWIFKIALKNEVDNLWKLFISKIDAKFKNFVPNPPLHAKVLGKIWKEWNERDLAILFHNTIRFLFWCGRGWSRQGRCWFVLACKEYQQSAWAGSGLDLSSFISVNLMVICIKVTGAVGAVKSTLKPQLLYIPAGFWGTISEFLPWSFSYTYPAKLDLAACRGYLWMPLYISNDQEFPCCELSSFLFVLEEGLWIKSTLSQSRSTFLGLVACLRVLISVGSLQLLLCGLSIWIFQKWIFNPMLPLCSLAGFQAFNSHDSMLHTQGAHTSVTAISAY